MSPRKITRCRICGNTTLTAILDLGDQALTGVFPSRKDQRLTRGPLELVKCQEDAEGRFCGLAQLGHSYDCSELYGKHYGYRSGLNASMVAHLRKNVEKILECTRVSEGDLILDIGANDGTLLKAYPQQGMRLVGIDPTIVKFKPFYPEHIQAVPDFFSAELVRKIFGSKKAKVVTSIAMFYDLEAPLDFMRQVYEILREDGVWVFEQSYLPTMLEKNSYDTVCHEHLEYYRLKQIQWMSDRVGFKIVDVQLNEVNGGSFSVTVAKANAPYPENKRACRELLGAEEGKELGTLHPYEDFRERVHRHRTELVRFIRKLKPERKRIFGYGASTKGNVILQFCGITEKELPCIMEVNPDKFGCYTPGTYIPIISEAQARAQKPDYLLALPWHFKENFLVREREYLRSGGRIVFPLPSLEVVGG